MRNGRAQEIEEEQKTAETAAATNAAIVAGIASTSNMRAEGSKSKKNKSRNMTMLRHIGVDSRKKKRRNEKATWPLVIFVYYFISSFLFWVLKKFHL